VGLVKRYILSPTQQRNKKLHSSDCIETSTRAAIPNDRGSILDRPMSTFPSPKLGDRLVSTQLSLQWDVGNLSLGKTAGACS
jgi:hypothetical protein